MIVFENTGEIDPRLITLLGVNVKESESPVGFFGTGLKYAIACSLRRGNRIRIQSGEAEFDFSAREEQIRGKVFGIISMLGRHDRLELGFTTDLGKHWEDWMIYRELWCNAHDESGAKVYEATVAPQPTRGLTRIIVEGLDKPHQQRWDFLLNPAQVPTWSNEGLDIFADPMPRGVLFYRGIAVQSLREKPALYTYNIKSKLTLTEDRTAGAWATDWEITRWITLIDDENLARAVLTSKGFESRLDFSYAVNWSEAWNKVGAELTKESPLSVHSSVRTRFAKSKEINVCHACGRPL
jgi:hypothetical protein